MNQHVLVVGACPVGMTMAAEHARYDVSVRIVDKSAQRTHRSKAVVLWSCTLELLDRAAAAGRSRRLGESGCRKHRRRQEAYRTRYT